MPPRRKKPVNAPAVKPNIKTNVQTVVVKVGDEPRKRKRAPRRRRRAPAESDAIPMRQLPPVVYQVPAQTTGYVNQPPIMRPEPAPVPITAREPVRIRAPILEDIGIVGTEGRGVEIIDVPTKKEQLSELMTPIRSSPARESTRPSITGERAMSDLFAKASPQSQISAPSLSRESTRPSITGETAVGGLFAKASPPSQISASSTKTANVFPTSPQAKSLFDRVMGASNPPMVVSQELQESEPEPEQPPVGKVFRKSVLNVKERPKKKSSYKNINVLRRQYESMSGDKSDITGLTRKELISKIAALS